MPINTASGTTISIGTTLADASADSYTSIGFVSTIGEFGRVYQEVEFNSLGDRNVLKFKGQRNDGTLSMELGRDLTDAGQVALWDALDSDQDYNFTVILNDASGDTSADGTTFIFKAKVMSFTTNVSDANSVVGATVTLGVKSGSIEETIAT